MSCRIQEEYAPYAEAEDEYRDDSDPGGQVVQRQVHHLAAFGPRGSTVSREAVERGLDPSSEAALGLGLHEGPIGGVLRDGASAIPVGRIRSLNPRLGQLTTNRHELVGHRGPRSGLEELVEFPGKAPQHPRALGVGRRSRGEQVERNKQRGPSVASSAFSLPLNPFLGCSKRKGTLLCSGSRTLSEWHDDASMTTRVVSWFPDPDHR